MSKRGRIVRKREEKERKTEKDGEKGSVRQGDKRGTVRKQNG